jgi:hypothetical protein
MKTMAGTFWETVNGIKRESGPFEPINNPLDALNSPFHPLRSPFHPLANPFHSLNNPFNPRRGAERAQVLQELLAEFVES